MTLAANQPYFLPYPAYWQLIASADIFLIGDDYNYIRKGWIPRNYILLGGGKLYFRIEVQHQSSFRTIRDTKIMPVNVSDKLATLHVAYHKAPYFSEGFSLAETILRCGETGLADFLEFSIREVCSYLDIDTKIGRTSDFPGNARLRREERIYDFCSRAGADTYVNAIGGQSLYDFRQFSDRGLRLRFIESRFPAYPQFGDGFVPGLSILDAIMFNSREDLRSMLGQYGFIDGGD